MDHKWYYLNDKRSHGKLLNYTKIVNKKSNAESECACLRYDGSWQEAQSSCRELSLCSVCEIKGTPVFTIKGLCYKSDYDWNYYLITDSADRIKFYEGYKRSQIRFDTNKQEWIFAPHSDYYKNTAAKMEAKENHLLNHPIGRKKWLMNDPFCKVDGAHHFLTMSMCDFPNQFTCSTGHCIDIKYRCDLTKQCLDGSDEDFCDWVHIPSGYNAANPPESPDESKPIEIRTAINIENIDSIDTVNMILEMTTKLTIQWHDKDLTFSNLVAEKHNIIPNEKLSMIWTPLRDMIYGNEILGERDTEKNYKMSVYGAKTEITEGDNPRENLWFNGSYNPMRMTVRMKTTYRCTFDVRRFPFDEQQCPIIMKINQQRHYKMRFIDNRDTIYSGERIIDQFSIAKIHNNVTYSSKSTKFTVIIPMSRIAINQFLNTFVPTVILWLFGYSTLFIEPNENGFANRFMGSGTALLVIATLINAVKSDLPKTAYTKFIDIWFLWHVLSVFIVIVYHIVLDRIRKNLEDPQKLENEVFEYEDHDENATDAAKTTKIRKINEALIVLFPILNGVFYMLYFYLISNFCRILYSVTSVKRIWVIFERDSEILLHEKCP